MESNQLNNTTNEDAVIEALTLTCEINEDGTKVYRNKEGKLHRNHGPAIIWCDGEEEWYKDGKCHREDGPARIFESGKVEFWVNGKELTKNQFNQWKKDNGK